MASPELPPGLEEALRQLCSYARWAWPERTSDEDPSAGAAQQVTLVLCGRVSSALRTAASPEQATTALEAVRQSLGSEAVLAKRLGEVLTVEAGCILTSGQAAADQGVAVVADFLTSYTQLEGREAEHLSSQAGRAAVLAGLGPSISGQRLGDLLLPTLLECILAGATRSWECDWEMVRPQLQPLHDLALESPLLEHAAASLLRLVRDHAPNLLPEQPDSDIEEEEEDTARRHQRQQQAREEPSPRCIYALACLAQEIYDGLVAEDIHKAHGEEISLMAQLQHEVLHRLAQQGSVQHELTGRSGVAVAPQKAAVPRPTKAMAKPQAVRTPSPKRAKEVLETPPKPSLTPKGRRHSSTGPSFSETPLKLSLDKSYHELPGEAIPVPVSERPKCSKARVACVASRSQQAAPEMGAAGRSQQAAPEMGVAGRSQQAAPEMGDAGIRAFMEEVVGGSGAQGLASCLTGRAEDAASIIAAQCVSSHKSPGPAAVEEAKGKGKPEADSAAAKLVDLASYLQLLLELSSDGQAGVAAQLGRLVRCLLDGASWPDHWRYALSNMLELVTHPLLAKQAAAELWARVTDGSTETQDSSTTNALAVGSLANELIAVLEKETGEGAGQALASMKCLKLSAQLHLQWMRQLVTEVCGPMPASATAPSLAAPAVQKSSARKVDDAAPSCSGRAEVCRSSESEAEQSEDIGSDETPSAPSVASGDRASDLEDFIDFTPEYNSCGLLTRSGSPPRGPASSREAAWKMAERKPLAPKVQEYYNSKLVPGWEARVRSLLLKRPAPATEPAAPSSLHAESSDASKGKDGPCKRTRLEALHVPSRVLSAIA